MFFCGCGLTLFKILDVMLPGKNGFSIWNNYANWHRLEQETHSSLQTLIAGDGLRPSDQMKQNGQTHDLLAPPAASSVGSATGRSSIPTSKLHKA